MVIYTKLCGYFEDAASTFNGVRGISTRDITLFLIEYSTHVLQILKQREG